MANLKIQHAINYTLQLFFLILLILTPIYSGNPICIDGLFNDWDEVSIAYQDNHNDHINADFSTLKITYDSDFLFIYIKFHDNEFLMQNWNEFHLYMDVDNDSLTGNFRDGIGADLEWFFGDRSGKSYVGSQINTVYQNDLKLRIAPTITSSEFEIAIARDSSPLTLNNQQSLVQGKIIFSEFGESIGDLLPDVAGGVSFFIGEDFVMGPEPITLARLNESDLRVVSYNTLNEGILDNERQDHFKRILQTINPDIIALQEHSDWDEIHEIIQSWFPMEIWYASWTYRDLVILSRFQIIHDANIISSGRTMAALLNTEDELGKNLLIFNSHLSCCDNNNDRQEQVDEFSSVWRTWVQNGNGPFELEHGTPFIHLGDFNYVGYKQQVETIKSGDIVDESQFGVDFLPDWDSTAIIDLFSRQTHKRMGYTWRKDGSSFNPGKLDYLFYSDASIDTGKHYILNTLAMDQNSLSEYNLQSNDTQEASDHLPLVFDIVINSDLGTREEVVLPTKFTLHQNYPNPFNPTTQIKYDLPFDSFVNITIYDVIGRKIKSLFNNNQTSGYHSLEWNATNDIGEDVSGGMYIYSIQAGEYRATMKMVLLK